MNPKLVIFDLDGTLLDTLDDLGAAVNYAMVGDSPTDMQTAANGGIKSIAVGWGYRPMNDIGGLRVANTAEELLKFINL